MKKVKITFCIGIFLMDSNLSDSYPSSEEGRLPPSIRPVIERRNPQRTNLLTDTSYDTTKALIWFIVAMCVVSGAWEAGAVVGGLQMLGSGQRSARAE